MDIYSERFQRVVKHGYFQKKSTFPETRGNPSECRRAEYPRYPDGGGTARKGTVVYDREGRHGSFVDGVAGVADFRADRITPMIVVT